MYYLMLKNVVYYSIQSGLGACTVTCFMSECLILS